MSCLEKIVEYVRARSAITIVSAHGKMISGLTKQVAEVGYFFALAHHHEGCGLFPGVRTAT